MPRPARCAVLSPTLDSELQCTLAMFLYLGTYVTKHGPPSVGKGRVRALRPQNSYTLVNMMIRWFNSDFG